MTKLQQLLRAKDQEFWDLEKQLDGKTKLLAELEEARNKKSKSKKQIDCVACLKKDGDI